MRYRIAVFACVAFASSAAAQVYPSRAITIVVPFAAGGPTDVIARLLSQPMRAFLGQQVLVENVTGANGNVGVGKVARAAPDGYTLSIGHWSTHVVNGAVYTLPYDVLKDFEPVSLISTNSYLVVAKNAVPATDLKSFIAWLKANPDKALEGTAGAGSPQHVGGIFFQQATGTRFQFVPYRGAAPAMQALLGGEVDMIIDDPTSSLPQVRAGKIKAFAVTAKERLAAAPDIPTVDEAGLPKFYFSRWHALWVPRGTPKDAVMKLNAAVVSALADREVRTRLSDLGQEIFPREQQSAAALAAHHKAEIAKWWPIIKAAGIKAE
ncbi:MAG TPA: tripartite tricarboxylate transporter substrate-binding protein [Burkholderiales bacterium]|nr:tripartite tricarboxylate transporter substrate-binding protein [Burkholderiales bacterium]